MQKLERIQTLETRKFNYDMKFGLGSDVIFIGEQRQLSKDFKFEVHRWNASAARFVRDTETEDRLKVAVVHFDYMQIYVDDEYLILDF